MRIKLFCLPYAGGSETIFQTWNKYTPDFVEIIPIELAGRGKRYDEPYYVDFNDAVDDVFNVISKNIKDREPYAFFGHSMGSLIAYELYYKIKYTSFMAAPEHIFFSGSNAPHIINNNHNYHTLPNDEFIKKIIEIGGTSVELFEKKSMADIFIPLLKADFKVAETYVYTNKFEPISCDITIFTGKEDQTILMNRIDEWSEHTKGNFEIFEFEGDHFFIKNNESNILKIINKRLLRIKNKKNKNREL